MVLFCRPLAVNRKIWCIGRGGPDEGIFNQSIRAVNGMGWLKTAGVPLCEFGHEISPQFYGGNRPHFQAVSFAGSEGVSPPPPLVHAVRCGGALLCADRVRPPPVPRGKSRAAQAAEAHDDQSPAPGAEHFGCWAVPLRHLLKASGRRIGNSPED